MLFGFDLVSFKSLFSLMLCKNDTESSYRSFLFNFCTVSSNNLSERPLYMRNLILVSTVFVSCSTYKASNVWTNGTGNSSIEVCNATLTDSDHCWPGSDVSRMTMYRLSVVGNLQQNYLSNHSTDCTGHIQNTQGN